MSLANYPPDHPGFGRLTKSLKPRVEKIGCMPIDGEMANGWKVVFGPKEAVINIGELWFTGQSKIIAKRYEPGMPVRRCETMKEACAFLEGHI